MCELYGSKCDEVNEARYELFHKKYSKQNKLIDLALLPPCKNVLEKHLQRANYVSRLWKCCGIANTDYPPPGQHGWDMAHEINWCDDVFPNEIDELLMLDDEDSYEFGEDENETDDDYNDDNDD